MLGIFRNMGWKILYDYKTTWDYRCGESACPKSNVESRKTIEGKSSATE
jgi:hypothetical protein